MLLVAPGPLAVWVVANLHYSRVLKQIAPLEGQLNQLTGDLKESQDRLKQCQAELLALDEQVGCRCDFESHGGPAPSNGSGIAQDEGYLISRRAVRRPVAKLLLNRVCWHLGGL
jgi:hypothetical protein